MISKRLEITSQLLTKGNVVADIGCDHAYTSIYMIQQNIATHVIAMDINQGPLEKAKENIKKYNCNSEIETRRSDGAQKLALHEVDAILMSGMGGPLMCKILEDSKTVIQELSEMVLQPQSEIYQLRHYLHDHGWKIVKEDMIIEDHKFYTMMKVIKGIEHYDHEYEYRYGKYLIQHNHPICKQFLEKEKMSLQKILTTLESNPSSLTLNHRIKELEEQIQWVEKSLELFV